MSSNSSVQSSTTNSTNQQTTQQSQLQSKSSLHPPPALPSYESTLPIASTKIPSYPIMTVQHGSNFYNPTPHAAQYYSPLATDPNHVRSAPVNTPLYPRVNTVTPTSDLLPQPLNPKLISNAKTVYLRRTKRSRGYTAVEKQFTSYLDEFKRAMYYNDVDNSRGYLDGQPFVNRALITPANVARLKKLVDREIELFGPNGQRYDVNRSHDNTTGDSLQKAENNKVHPVQLFLQRNDSNWTNTALQTKTNLYENDGIATLTSLPQLQSTGPIHFHPGLNAYYKNDQYNSTNDTGKLLSVNNMKNPTGQEQFMSSSFAKALQDTYTSTAHWERINTNNPYLGGSGNNDGEFSQGGNDGNVIYVIDEDYYDHNSIPKDLPDSKTVSGLVQPTIRSRNRRHANTNANSIMGDNEDDEDEDGGKGEEYKGVKVSIDEKKIVDVIANPRQSLRETIIAVSKIIYDDLYLTSTLGSNQMENNNQNKNDHNGQKKKNNNPNNSTKANNQLDSIDSDLPSPNGNITPGSNIDDLPNEDQEQIKEILIRSTTNEIIPMKKKDYTGKATGSLFYLRSLFSPPRDLLQDENDDGDDDDDNNKKANTGDDDADEEDEEEKAAKRLDLEKFPLPTLDEICAIVTNLLISSRLDSIDGLPSTLHSSSSTHDPIDRLLEQFQGEVDNNNNNNNKNDDNMISITNPRGYAILNDHSESNDNKHHLDDFSEERIPFPSTNSTKFEDYNLVDPSNDNHHTSDYSYDPRANTNQRYGNTKAFYRRRRVNEADSEIDLDYSFSSKTRTNNHHNNNSSTSTHLPFLSLQHQVNSSLNDIHSRERDRVYELPPHLSKQNPNTSINGLDFTNSSTHYLITKPTQQHAIGSRYRKSYHPTPHSQLSSTSILSTMNSNPNSLNLTYQQPLTSYVPSTVTDQHPWSKFTPGPTILMYSEDEYQQLLIEPSWTQQQTDRLLDLCYLYNCNFTVVHDRFVAHERLDNIKTSVTTVMSEVQSGEVQFENDNNATITYKTPSGVVIKNYPKSALHNNHKNTDDNNNNNNNNPNTNDTTMSDNDNNNDTNDKKETSDLVNNIKTTPNNIDLVHFKSHQRRELGTTRTELDLVKDNIVDIDITPDMLECLRDIKGDDFYIPGNKSIHVHLLPDAINVAHPSINIKTGETISIPYVDSTTGKVMVLENINGRTKQIDDISQYENDKSENAFLLNTKVKELKQTRVIPPSKSINQDDWSFFENGSNGCMNSISTKTQFQPILTKHVLSITTEPIIPAPLYPTYLTPFHQNPINAEFPVANNAGDVLSNPYGNTGKSSGFQPPGFPTIQQPTTSSSTLYPNYSFNPKDAKSKPGKSLYHLDADPHPSALIDYTTPSNNENTITPAFTGPLLNNTGGQLPNGAPYELMLANPSMALLAVSSYISQLQQDTQQIPFPQLNTAIDQLYRNWSLKRYSPPVVNLSHYNLPTDDDNNITPRSLGMMMDMNNKISGLNKVYTQRPNHLTIEEHQHAPVIPYFASLGLGIGSYLRTERKVVSAAFRTLEELQSRFFTIQAILLRHRLRAECGGVIESTLLPTQQFKELTIYNHDYDAQRRYELSKVFARNSYLMALVSRCVTDLHILTKIWDCAKEQMTQWRHKQALNSMMNDPSRYNQNTVGTQAGSSTLPSQQALGSGTGGRVAPGLPTQQPHHTQQQSSTQTTQLQQPPSSQQSTQTTQTTRGSTTTTTTTTLATTTTQVLATPASSTLIPAQKSTPQQTTSHTLPVVHQVIAGVYPSPFPYQSTLSTIITYLLPTPLFNLSQRLVQQHTQYYLTRQLPQRYGQVITEIMRKILSEDHAAHYPKDPTVKTFPYDVGDPHSFQYLLYPRDREVEAYISKTVVSLEIKTKTGDQGSNLPTGAPQAYGVIRRSTLQYDTFNTYYGFPRETIPLYQNNPLVRPSPAVALAHSGQGPVPNMKQKQPGANHQQPVTLTDQINSISTTVVDPISGLLSLRSLVRQVDQHLVTHDLNIWSGKPVNLEQAYSSLDLLFQKFPQQRPAGLSATGQGTTQRSLNQLLTMQPAHHYFTPYLNHQANNIFDSLHTEIKHYRSYHDKYVAELRASLPLIYGVKIPSTTPPESLDPTFANQLLNAGAQATQQTHENMELLENHLRPALNECIETKRKQRLERENFRQEQMRIAHQQQAAMMATPQPGVPPVAK